MFRYQPEFRLNCTCSRAEMDTKMNIDTDMDIEMLDATPPAPVFCPSCSYTFTPHLPHPHIAATSYRSGDYAQDAEIARWISEEESELSKFQAEISRIRSILASMELRESELTERISERKSLVSSVRRLPSELWAEIFALCMGVSTSGQASLAVSKSDWNNVSAPPLVLSHVCSRWRSILHTTPNLWSTLDVNLYALDRDITPLLNHYFDLAKSGRGVDLLVRCKRGALGQWRNPGEYKHRQRLGEGRGASWTEFSKGAMNIVVERVRECVQFEVRDVGEYWDFESALAMSRSRGQMGLFPILESVSLDIQDADADQDQSKSNSGLGSGSAWWNAMKSAPRLHSVTLDAGLCLSSTNLSSLLVHPDSQIQALEVRNLGLFEGQMRDLVEVVGGLRSLRTLRIQSLHGRRARRGVSFPGSERLPVVRNETLQRLELSTRDTDGLFSLLDHLDLPALRSVSLSSSPDESQPVGSSALEEIFRTLTKFPLLRDLTIDFEVPETQVGCLRQLLYVLPQLEVLTARVRVRGGARKSCMVELFSSLSSGTIGTRLKRLSVTEPDLALSVDLAERFIGVLGSRVSSGLEEVDLAFGGCCYYDVRKVARMDERLRAMESEGMKVGFYYESYGNRVFLLGVPN
ncbi:hypothetical protein PQX77_011015 [Marasmius sp. AFHP31]|nr:hypothetical protein PQX77_011015 [Marasmius sp. AFHP31]